jgi:hypothetical protein
MIKPNHKALAYFFWFSQHRMDMFWKRWEGQPPPWTMDGMLNKYKLTNVYRACDRVSQYLIREVIYHPEAAHFSAEDTLLRILVFKVFNKPDTWQYLEEQLGEPLTIANYNPLRFKQWLLELKEVQAIFNGAYIMAGSHQAYPNQRSKHGVWLEIIQQEFIEGAVLSKIAAAQSFQEVYQLLRNCSLIGGFLAYQYAIDFNYSEVIDFSENSFTKAGIGAQRGIQKCFEMEPRYSYEDYVKYTQDHSEELRKRYGYTDFVPLFGRKMTLVDYQSGFCETDKILRVKLPELNLKQRRIKQIYKPSSSKPIQYFFPPKWGINQYLE